MKVLVIGSKDRYMKYLPNLPIIHEVEMIFCPRGSDDDTILEIASDVDAIAVDPISILSAKVISNMPNLKIIQSEGVGFNLIDLEAAKNKGVFVCNCKGANASAVAEQTILLMLAVLRDMVVNDGEERKGHQMQVKEKMMYEGIVELGDCKVGLIGFGDIAKATAKRLIPFDCEIYYYSRTRKSKDIEETYNAKYMSLDELISSCDIVSIHCPATAFTKEMVNEEFLKKMKPSAYLINTARGEVVDNKALAKALMLEEIKGAGLDTVAPEPTTKDNILLNLPEEHANKIIFSPHIGGITSSYFKRAHKRNWININKAINGERPDNIVNDL
ncbi:2-hydroxyacid dehydrogenase [Clostridium sp. DL1XJH146]